MKKILVVDDNAMMRKMIISLLSENDIQIEEAIDGRDALDLIEKFSYDLVITDILMPRIEGTELIMEIRRMRPDAGIIAISGAKPYYLYVAKKLGVNAVFTKPLNPAKFHEAVNQMLYVHPDSLTKSS
jgi:CheY-like chemotaxis protein